MEKLVETAERQRTRRSITVRQGGSGFSSSSLQRTGNHCGQLLTCAGVHLTHETMYLYGSLVTLSSLIFNINRIRKYEVLYSTVIFMFVNSYFFTDCICNNSTVFIRMLVGRYLSCELWPYLNLNETR